MAQRQEEPVNDAIARIYETAIDPAHWPEALEAVRRLFNGAGAVVFAMDHKAQDRLVQWHSINLETDGGEYGERLHRINPRARLSMDEQPGSICYDYRAITEREIDRSEFYDGIRKLSGVRYFIGSRALECDGVSFFASVERTQGQGHVDETDIACFQRLAPHFANAKRLSQRVAGARIQSSLYDLLNDTRGEALILLDTQGQVTGMNGTAETILAKDDGIALAEGRIKIWKSADQRELDRSLAAALAATAGHSQASGGALVLARPSGALPLLLRVLPWPRTDMSGGPQPAAIILLRDPGAQPRRLAINLRHYFGLTAREIALAERLAKGEALRGASLALGISYNTARVHLQNIFTKTCVSNQKDLLRLVMSLP